MFLSILDELTQKGRGIHAYGAAAKLAFAQAQAQPAAAAGFYVLGKIAEEFVDLHERMPLSTEALAQFFAHYEGVARTLETAHATGDAGKMLAALNAVCAAPSLPV